MQAVSEHIDKKDEILNKLMAIELVFILRLKIRTLIIDLQRPFTPDTYNSQKEALRLAQINTLLCQKGLQDYLNSSHQLSCLDFFIDTLRKLTSLQKKMQLKAQKDPTSSDPIQWDAKTLNILENLQKRLALQTSAIDEDYQSFLPFLGKSEDQTHKTTLALRKSVFAAENLNELIAVVETNPDKVHQIAGMLYDDPIIFSIRFMHYDAYSFFHLMEQFPPSFQAAVNLYMELDLTPEIESNYHFNAALKLIIKEHRIALINPFKYLLQPQDPVFFYLDTPQFCSQSPASEIAQIKIAIENIKKDPRFIIKGSEDHLNQAGIDLRFYLEGRLENLREKLPLITPTSEDPLDKPDRSIIYYRLEKWNPPPQIPSPAVDESGLKPERNLSVHHVEKLKPPREKVQTFTKALKAILTHFKEDFLAVYGFDGFEVTAHKATADIEVRPYKGTLLPLSLAICSFLGLPTRAAHFTRHDPLYINPKNNSRYEPNFSPNFNFLQLLRNFIGGWVPIRDKQNWQWTPKKKAQIIFLPFKIFIILPIKIISVPCKFFLNVLKLLTELLPTVLVDGLRTAYKNLFKLALTVFDYEKAAGLNKLPAILIGLASLAVLIVFVLMNIVKKIGIAWTSPEKSARMAFNYGYKFIVELTKSKSENDIDSESNEDLAFAIGVILGFVSILTTAVSWAIFLPLTLGTLFTYFPTFIQSVTWVLHSPLFSTGFAAFQTSLLNLGAFLGTSLSFGSIVSNLAAVIGVQVSGTLLITSTALAFIAPPFTAIISRLAEGFSNTWARWGNIPLPPQKIKEPFLNNIAEELESALTPPDRPRASSQPTTPSLGPLSLVHSFKQDSDTVLKQSLLTDRREAMALDDTVSTTTHLSPVVPDSSSHQQSQDQILAF